MPDLESRVRDAAVALHDAIIEAREQGLRVEWPANQDGLLSIAISETGSYKPDTVPETRVPAVALPTKTE